jgi:hypothetical protein
VMALRTFFVGELLRAGDGLRNLEGGEVVMLALEGRWVVGAAGGCCGGFGPEVCANQHFVRDWFWRDEYFLFWFSHWSRTGVDGLAEIASYFGEFGFAGSGEEVAACFAEE